MDCSARHILFRLIKATQLCFSGLCVLIVSCSSVPQPEDPVEQYLDEETLVSISRMTDPIAFYRGFGINDQIGQRAQTAFAYVAPFEVNHMGNYKLYLWAALPTDNAINSKSTHSLQKLTLQLDYDLLVFETPLGDWRELGIGEPVYSPRMDSENWSVFELTQETLALIVSSEEIYLNVSPDEIDFDLWEEKTEVNKTINAFLNLLEF